MNIYTVILLMIALLLGYVGGRVEFANDVASHGCKRAFGYDYCVQGQWANMYTDGTFEITKEVLK